MNLIAQLLPGYQRDAPGGFFGTAPLIGRAGGAVGTGFLGLFNPASPGNSLSLVIARILLFATIVSGLIFFVKLMMAGFSYLTSAGDSNKIQAATKEITNATIGLLIVISTFFLAQIIQVVLGIKII